MSAKRETTQQQLDRLEAENKKLRQKLGKLDTSVPVHKKSAWKTVLIVLSVGFAGALLVTGNVIFWTGQTLIDNNRYVQATAPLIENTDIQDAIANKTTQAIFSRVDVEAVAQNALPPKAEFLAPTLSQQVQTFTNQKTKEILATPSFQDTWNQVNSNAHQRLINFIKNYQGDGTFNIQDLYNKITEKLQQSKLSFLGGKTLPADIGSITIVTASNLPTLHWIVVNLWWIRLLSILLFVCLSALAIAITNKRRRMVVRMSLLYATVLFVLMIAVRIARTIMVGKVTPEYQAAATATWSIILHPLFLQTVALIALFLVTAVGAWISGSGKHAVAVRSMGQQIINGKLHHVIFKKENRFTKWIQRNMRVIIICLTALAGITLLLIHISLVNIFAVVIGLLVLLGLVQLFAAKK